MRALKKQIGKAERAVRVLIRNQRKDDHEGDSPNNSTNSSSRSRRNSTDHHETATGDVAAAGSSGGPLKVKLHIKMADFHSEATALMTPPPDSENDATLTATTISTGSEAKVDVVSVEGKGGADEKQHTEENEQSNTTTTVTAKGKKNNNRSNNKNKKRKGALTTRSSSRRKPKDDSTAPVANATSANDTNQSQLSTKQPSVVAATNTSSRRKRSKYYVYEDELYAATQQKKPLYDASSLGSAVSLPAEDLDPAPSVLSPETVDFTMISSDVDFDIEFDYDMRPDEEVYLTADDILSSLQSLAEESLSDEAVRQMEKACQERLSKVRLYCTEKLGIKSS